MLDINVMFFIFGQNASSSSRLEQPNKLPHQLEKVILYSRQSDNSAQHERSSGLPRG